MDDSSMELLQNGTEEEVNKVLREFNSKNVKTFTFPDLDQAKKQILVTVIFHKLSDDTFPKCHATCLETLRILSRDKSGLEVLVTKDILAMMVRHAGLEFCEDDNEENKNKKQEDSKVMVEAQKCLCNLIFNSSSAQRFCSRNGCIEGIVQRLKTYKDPELPHEIKFFDMRMLFLLTALCADIRPRLRNELHGITYLMEVIDLIIKNCNDDDDRADSRWGRRGSRGGSGDDAPRLSDNDVDLACEVLKILFNLTVQIDKNNLDEEEEAHFMRLVSILHDILLCKAATKEKREELQSHTVNLLTNMPSDSYEELLTPLNEGAVGGQENKDLEYDGQNMEAIVVLLEFLDRRLNKPGFEPDSFEDFNGQTNKKPIKSMKEMLSPILSCLCECARSNRIIRKFLRSKVLPPLRDVMHRPEEGTALRNKLCRLMTSPITDVKELVADFLFILCKESVGRLVKYTGYGNAAGLLASRGLMRGGKGKGGDYSSESEDSDTEEYLAYRDQSVVVEDTTCRVSLSKRINPVIGCYEEPRPNPMEGMSDEQKEYEAVQLVNMMDKLSREGVVQPMRIGEDGKPHPIGHVLELQEAMNVDVKNEDSD